MSIFDRQSPQTRFARNLMYCGDQDLEAAIEGVGREKVFERAAAIGWAAVSEAPPKWVWWAIVRELEAGNLT